MALSIVWLVVVTDTSGTRTLAAFSTEEAALTYAAAIPDTAETFRLEVDRWMR